MGSRCCYVLLALQKCTDVVSGNRTAPKSSWTCTSILLNSPFKFCAILNIAEQIL